MAGGNLSIDPERRRLTLPAPDGFATLSAVLQLLADAEVAIDDISLRRPSLEDVFLSITGPGADETTPTADRRGLRRKRR
jgi:ABC-2 type transport system ATP-binding protein